MCTEAGTYQLLGLCTYVFDFEAVIPKGILWHPACLPQEALYKVKPFLRTHQRCCPPDANSCYRRRQRLGLACYRLPSVTKHPSPKAPSLQLGIGHRDSSVGLTRRKTLQAPGLEAVKSWSVKITQVIHLLSTAIQYIFKHFTLKMTATELTGCLSLSS